MAGRSNLCPPIFKWMLVLVVTLSATGCGKIVIPSDPKTWPLAPPDLPAGTRTCPGGHIDALRDVDRALRAYTPASYAAAYRVGLDGLWGVCDTDEIYPFEVRWPLSEGMDSAVRGYLVVREGCIIHAHATEYDN